MPHTAHPASFDLNTMATPPFLRDHPDGALLFIKLQPRASTNEIGEPLGNELRVKVTAPPVDSAANEALIRLVADRFDCPRSRVELIRGHTSATRSSSSTDSPSEPPSQSWAKVCSRAL